MTPHVTLLFFAMFPPRKTSLPARLSALTLAALSLASPAQAQNGGRLVFLGWTADLQHSVWLSAVLPGVYDLRSAQYGTHFDDWTQARRGLHLTVSPEVSEWGGTHNLFIHITDQYSSYQNWVASDDQQPGRFTFPNTWTPPTIPTDPVRPTDPDTLTPTVPQGVTPPVAALPPSGVTPTVPLGVAPPIATLPPQGVSPPIATLPPTGITPSVPSTVRPPIATLPPSGLTPGVPQGVTPPVATLPPAGLTPSVPSTVRPPIATLPPSGLTPGVPQGVTPPIATLPPSGLTPSMPQGVTPPIATLPPTGITPSVPSTVRPPIATLPPSGLTPSVPGTVLPPVATLPPAGLTPTVPTPPIGNRPPQGISPTRPPLGMLPERPVAPIAPLPSLPPTPPTGPQGLTPTVPTIPPLGGALPPGARPVNPVPPEPISPAYPGGTVAAISAGGQANSQGFDSTLYCPPSTKDTTPTNGVNNTNCIPQPVEAAGQKPVPPRRWNVWTDLMYLDLKDHRNDSDMTGRSTSFTIGADTRLDSGLIVGLTTGWQNSHSSSFDGGMQLDSKTRSLGGYVAGAVSKNWMLDGTLTYSQSDNTQNLLVLSGDFDASNWATTLGASGQYLVDKTLLRPRVALNYSHYNADGYTMRGNYAGLALQLPTKEQSSNYGSVVLSTEISRVYFTDGGMPVVPYVEPSIEYAFTRPNDGRMMAGDLSSVRTSATSGAIRAGVRFLVTRNSNLTAAAGYTSLGQNGLNVREFRVYFSHAF